MSNQLRLQYLFDPLCGWCYASAPALAGLAKACAEALELMPCGMFSAGGGRAMTPEWANYAWSNDQRIAAITGQVFSEAYRRQVLLREGGRFDSTMLNRALTAVRAVDAALEPALLHALQLARYVDGRDTSRAEVVAEVCLASGPGWGSSAEALAERLRTDAGLQAQTDARIRETQALMHELGVNGVPQLFASSGDDAQVFGGASLYRGPAALLAELGERFGIALPAPASR